MIKSVCHYLQKRITLPLLLFLFFPQILSFLYFSPAAIYPLNGSWNVTLIYNYQQKCVPYINKIIPFSFSSFSFPLFPSFSFCSSLPQFSFFFIVCHAYLQMTDTVVLTDLVIIYKYEMVLHFVDMILRPHILRNSIST